MDFGRILAPSWGPKSIKNRYTRGLENDKKMMMTKMATKSDLDDHEGKRPLGFEALGKRKEEG